MVSFDYLLFMILIVVFLLVVFIYADATASPALAK